MSKEICLRCEFIKEGCEVDNGGYFYEECPECGFKHYEEDFCRKCLKIYDYSYKHSDYCKECYENIELFYCFDTELETELILGDNLSIMKKVKKDCFENKKYIKFHYNNEDYVLCSDLKNLFKYLNKDINKNTFLENSEVRRKPFVDDKRYTYHTPYYDIQDFDFDSVLLDNSRGEINNFKENLKNIIVNECKKFNELVKKLTISDEILKEIKTNLFDIIIYDGMSGNFNVSKVIINDDYIICWLDASDWDSYNDEPCGSYRICVFDRKDGSLLENKYYHDNYCDDNDEEEHERCREYIEAHYDNVEKYILEKYRSKCIKDEVVANTKQFVDYFLTRRIENPFEI